MLCSRLPLVELQGLSPDRQLLLQGSQSRLQDSLLLLQLLHHQQLGIHLQQAAPDIRHVRLHLQPVKWRYMETQECQITINEKNMKLLFKCVINLLQLKIID